VLVKHLAADGANAAHDMDLRAIAAIGERHIGGGEFQRRHFRGAERDRGVGGKPRFHAEPMGGLDHRARADFHGKLRGDRIQRFRQRRRQAHLPVIFALVIVGRPFADPHRRVVARAFGRAALFQRGQKDERLEG
jgi:hypothetical protein